MDPFDNRPSVSRDDLARLPYLTWNAFVDLLASAEFEGLTRVQRPAWLAFRYDAEVQNGGHRQFFANRGTGSVGPTIEALNRLGATCQVEVLLKAATRFEAVAREPQQGSELDKALDDLDQDYHRCRPEIHELLESYLDNHLDGFLKID
jgi:hypothetical protein